MGLLLGKFCQFLTIIYPPHNNVGVLSLTFLLHYEAIFTNTHMCFYREMSHCMTKPTKWHVRPAKTRISLGIRPVCSESSLSA